MKIKVKKEWGDKDVDNVVQNIKNTLGYPRLLSVFRLDSRDIHEIDIAILTALLKGIIFFYSGTEIESYYVIVLTNKITSKNYLLDSLDI